ncbi:MAG: lipopolysaccharide heptosyltransferase I [Tatlockia sp.]|nr:lipopolysaccharide heptosyltransferase I [Tatlockia sp.]
MNLVMKNGEPSNPQPTASKKILLVKITSMGDLIQTLPALTDATKAFPGINFDWVVDESFQEIPRLHPSVDKTIVFPYRRWKKNKWKAWQSGEVSQFLKELRSVDYDMVIDVQSNIKSAILSLFTKGRTHGLDSQSVHEYGAHFAYSKKITINRQQNHAERVRQMMAKFLGYKIPQDQADYGVNSSLLPSLDFSLPEKFIMAIPIASTINKLWPEPYWQQVIQDLVRSDYDVILPWWSNEEKARALRLKNSNPRIHLLPPLNLTQKASVLARAQAVISIDTGLAHMAGMLNIPNICIYGSSNPLLCGTIGHKQIHLTARGLACSPCSSSQCTYQGLSQYKPACLETIKPQQVLTSLYELLAS